MRQLSNSYVSKDTIKKVKGQLTKWEKIFSNHISYEELYAEYTKSTPKSHSKRTNSPIKHGQRMNRHLTKEDVQMVNKPMKKCLL